MNNIDIFVQIKTLLLCKTFLPQIRIYFGRTLSRKHSNDAMDALLIFKILLDKLLKLHLIIHVQISNYNVFNI